MSAEKMREEFRTWHSEQVARLVEHGEPTAAKVWRDFESFLWSTWQASRAAIEVELPKVAEYFDQSEYPHTCEMLERDLRSRIESLGLKVKL